MRTKDFCFIIKLGDGNANLILNNEKVFSPDELADDTLQFNITTSLCNSDADVMFRHYFCNISPEDEDIVSGVLLSSDGVINCFRSVEAYNSFVENIYHAYGEESMENAKIELEEVLNIFSEKGSGDDLSIAVIRGEMTEEEKELLNTRREQEKSEWEKRKQEIEKKEAEAQRLRLESEKAELQKEKEEAEKIKLENERANAELEAKIEKIDKKMVALESEKIALKNENVLKVSHPDIIAETNNLETEFNTIDQIISDNEQEAEKSDVCSDNDKKE